jgi:hypothetical protein
VAQVSSNLPPLLDSSVPCPLFNLPEEKSLPGDDVPVPYYIVGDNDNAFVINKRLMNPFAIRNMEHHERIFNYRLSRARRVVQNQVETSLQGD